MSERAHGLCRNRNFSFFVRLWRPGPVWFVADSDCRSFEVDVRPVGVHDLLFSHACHQEKLIPQPLFRVTSREKRLKLFVLVNLRYSSVYRGQSFLLASPLIPFAFRKGLHF